MGPEEGFDRVLAWIGNVGNDPRASVEGGGDRRRGY